MTRKLCDYDIFPTNHPAGWELVHGIPLPPAVAERHRTTARRRGAEMIGLPWLRASYILEWARWATADRARRIAEASHARP